MIVQWSKYTFPGRWLLRPMWLLIIWCFAHYIAVHIYVRVCAPVGFYGFAQSMFTAPSALCSTLAWTIYHGCASIAQAWVIAGTWLASNVFVALSS